MTYEEHIAKLKGFLEEVGDAAYKKGLADGRAQPEAEKQSAERVEPVAKVVVANEHQAIIEWLGTPLPHQSSLYTSPPQRDWVGLTDEEYEPLRNGLIKEGKPLHWFAEQIEAKLKEKNT